MRAKMDGQVNVEKSRDRIEKRTAFVTTDISWLSGKDDWANLCCIGAIRTEFTRGESRTCQWHYYISSRNLSATELLCHARREWSVETMHWLLDVHFSEDFFRVANQTVQENMNLLRKFVLAIVKQFKMKSSSKRPLSQIMFDCLLSSDNILKLLS